VLGEHLLRGSRRGQVRRRAFEQHELSAPSLGGHGPRAGARSPPGADDVGLGRRPHRRRRPAVRGVAR